MKRRFITTILLATSSVGLTLLIVLSLPQASLAAVPVFINEIHYDNTSTDTNEGVEIAGPAGTDLSAYTLILYNGYNGAQYGSVALSGFIPNLQNGYGSVWFSRSPLQNDTDGIALCTTGGSLIQFLSYEGDFAAVEGCANDITSTDILVSESASTPMSYSLQLQGNGRVYEDFSWGGPITYSHDAVNNGQTFLAAPNCFATANDGVNVYSSLDAQAVRQAVAAAAPGGVVKVAGVCAGVGSGAEIVYITQSLTVRGGYTSTNWNIADPAANPTTLDAQQAGRVVHIDLPGDGAVVLENLRLTGGNASGGNTSGGGVYNSNATLTISNSVIFSNTASDDGGGVFSSGQTQIINSAFYANQTGHDGGGVANNGLMTVTHSLFNGNQAEWGGALRNFGNLVVDACTLAGNSASQGGGISNWSGHTTLTNATFITGNLAYNVGGGIYNDNTGALTIANSQVVSNTAEASGGGLYNGMVMTITGSVIQNNLARNGSAFGGGLYSHGDALLIDHSAIAGNGDTGIHISNDAAGIVIIHSTIISGHTTAGLSYAPISTALNVTLGGAPDTANTFRNNGLNINVEAPSNSQPIQAFYNDWGVGSLPDVETGLHHQFDDIALARVDYYTLTLQAAPTAQLADGLSSVTLTASLTGTLIPPVGEVIAFTTDLGTLSAPTDATTADLQASVSLTSTHTGTAHVTAHSTADPLVAYPAMAHVAWHGLYSSHINGVWSNGNTWFGGAAPGASDVVTISAGTVVTLDIGAQCHHLFVESGGMLVMPDGLTLAVESGLVNQGRLRQICANTPAGVGTPFLRIQDQAGLQDHYFGLVITPTGGALGSVTVTLRGGQGCGGSGNDNTVLRCYDIIPTIIDVASLVTFYYHATETISNTNPNVYHWNGTGWQNLGVVASHTSGDWRWAQANVTTYSPFILADASNEPTSVGLSEMSPRSGPFIGWAAVLLGLVIGTYAWWVRRRL